MIISGLRWTITTDFYMLFRGVLEKNLGDPLIPIPETVPIEILQKPPTGCVRFTIFIVKYICIQEVTNAQKYATLSFRLIFRDISLDCQVR